MAGICWDCAQDIHLKKVIQEADEELECSECGAIKRPAISAESLADHIEPIMREHFRQGAYDFDGQQSGDSIESILYDVIGQEVSFAEELADAVVDLDPAWPPDGDDPLWTSNASYVPTKTPTSAMHERWSSALEELKHSRRFFSPAAQRLFSELFSGVHDLQFWDDEGARNQVVIEMPAGTKLYRARVCRSSPERNAFFKDPARELGPPPADSARAGRMNPEGVSVFYSAESLDTAIAEMRPSIGMELVTAEFRTTESFGVLDFARLEKSFGSPLSFLQPDFSRQLERRHFLRRLHYLISQPVIPGREADYLITQTMAEYLTHIIDPPFAGIVFRSVQHNKGRNVVLSRFFNHLSDEPYKSFPVEYVPDSLKVVEVFAVSYTHRAFGSVVYPDGTVTVYDNDLQPDDDDD
jgi:hypothetical protein